MITASKTYIIPILLYSSLLFGFYFNEDSLGGAFKDFLSHSHISDKFRNNFITTLINYDELGHRHSPVFYIFKSLLFENILYMRLFFLHIFLLIPYFFYKSLILKFPSEKKFNLLILSSIIILFPTFRSYSIWPDPHLLGTLFFMISIFYFLKFLSSINKIKYAILNTIFLAISAYSSPNFGVFVIYFTYEFYKIFALKRNFFLILFVNFTFSLPFFYYLFIMNVNFIFNETGWDIGSNVFSINNFSNKFIILNSLFLFYLLPYLLFGFKFNEIKKLFGEKYFKILILIILFIFLCYNFDFIEVYKLTNSGGGFFYNLSDLLLKNNYILFLSSFLGFTVIVLSFFKYSGNMFLYFAMILSNPQLTLWQANYSPFIFMIIILLMNIQNKIEFTSKRNIYICLVYFFVYLVANVIYKSNFSFELVFN